MTRNMLLQIFNWMKVFTCKIRFKRLGTFVLGREKHTIEQKIFQQF